MAARVQIPASPLKNPRKINVPRVFILPCTPTVPQREEKKAPLSDENEAQKQKKTNTKNKKITGC